jgi:alkaline phosphatase D
MTHPLNRRDFVVGFGSSVLAVPLLGRASAQDDPSATFAHGVASGDPRADRAIIWTRVSPRRGRDVKVDWEVATDPGFRRVVRRGHSTAEAEHDHTVKVDVTDLSPDAAYYYRFHARDERSPTGRFRTLPVGQVAQVRLAVFSCSNYPAGYFNVYAEAARLNDVHAALHIGDYTYEYPSGGYGSQGTPAARTEVDPPTETITLDDYRKRYALYRTDPDLQAAHAAMAFICVWDDHEIANDTWKGGAENHDPATEGDFFARRAAAIQAYHEWMPIRAPEESRPERIYRSFSFGNLVDLHMLDTRVIGRDRQLAYADYLGAAGFDAARFAADMASPERQLLGAEQSQWLKSRMQRGRGLWTMLGQQVLMGRMNVPAPLLFPPALGGVTFTQYVTIVGKAQAGVPLSAQEQAVLAQPFIPYNLDAWDGYAVARETLLGTARALDKNLVVLAGDTHNAWASDLLDMGGNAVGVEFGVSSVTSPGFEEYFPNEDPATVAAGLEQLIGPLVYAETRSRGFMVVTATAQECRAEWRYVSTVKSRTYSTFTGKVLRTLPGAGSRHLIAA